MWHALPDSPEESGGFQLPGWLNADSDNMADPRCSHFSVAVVELQVPGIGPSMQVPVYRCSLAEEMVRRLRTMPEGEWLAERLEAPPLDGQPRLISGPDLEAITATTCIPDRCHRSCRPGFEQVLTEFALDPMPPEAE